MADPVNDQVSEAENLKFSPPYTEAEHTENPSMDIEPYGPPGNTWLRTQLASRLELTDAWDRLQGHCRESLCGYLCVVQCDRWTVVWL